VADPAGWSRSTSSARDIGVFPHPVLAGDAEVQATARRRDQVNVHGFITVSGEKMSKSRGTGIDPLKYLSWA
jgi:methionyl-tRNA synthetase